MMIRTLTTVVLALAVGAVAACGTGSDTGSELSAADTLTRAQKDSIVSELPIPGSRGVGAAMQARDRANARTERHDTIG
ncbi:MAG: hypothetical protein RJQ04_06920 [Longimicrobiales bacterium]